MPKENRFSHSAAALARYDEGAEARSKLWETAGSNEDADRAEAAEKEAADRVREAFWQDTRAINSRENCYRIAVQDIRDIVKRSGSSAKISRKVGKMMVSAITGSANP